MPRPSIAVVTVALGPLVIALAAYDQAGARGQSAFTSNGYPRSTSLSVSDGRGFGQTAKDSCGELSPPCGDGVEPVATLLTPTPNPLQDLTSLVFGLPKGQNVSLKVYAVDGRLVRTLVEGELPAGRHQVTFEAHGQPPGVYFAVLRTIGVKRVRTLLVLR